MRVYVPVHIRIHASVLAMYMYRYIYIHAFWSLLLYVYMQAFWLCICTWQAPITRDTVFDDVTLCMMM